MICYDSLSYNITLYNVVRDSLTHALALRQVGEVRSRQQSAERAQWYKECSLKNVCYPPSPREGRWGNWRSQS